MARFEFKLRGLLRLREVEEDRARREYFEMLKIRSLREQELAKLVTLREEEKAKCARGASGGALDMGELLRRQRYINLLYQRIVEKTAEVNGMRPDVEKARRGFVEARRRLKLVEKIRERRLEEFERQEARREIRELDEVGQVYQQLLAGRRSV